MRCQHTDLSFVLFEQSQIARFFFIYFQLVNGISVRTARSVLEQSEIYRFHIINSLFSFSILFFLNIFLYHFHTQALSLSLSISPINSCFYFLCK